MLVSVGATCPNSSSYLGFSVCAVRGTCSGSTKQAFLRSHQPNHFSGYIQGFLGVVSSFPQDINSVSCNSVGGAWGCLWSPRNFTGFLIYLFSIFFIQIFLWSRSPFHHFMGRPNSPYAGCVGCLCHLKEPASVGGTLPYLISRPCYPPGGVCLGHT